MPNPYIKIKTVLPDTSPLLLILMGLYDKGGIESFKRLSKYDIEDFELLLQYIGNILNENDLFKFGFTDISIILAARKNNALVLTDDFPLNGICKKIGINSIHIDEILSQKEIFET